jgi:hypothetical protein
MAVKLAFYSFTDVIINKLIKIRKSTISTSNIRLRCKMLKTKNYLDITAHEITTVKSFKG